MGFKWSYSWNSGFLDELYKILNRQTLAMPASDMLIKIYAHKLAFMAKYNSGKRDNYQTKAKLLVQSPHKTKI